MGGNANHCARKEGSQSKAEEVSLNESSRGNWLGSGVPPPPVESEGGLIIEVTLLPTWTPPITHDFSSRGVTVLGSDPRCARASWRSFVWRVLVQFRGRSGGCRGCWFTCRGCVLAISCCNGGFRVGVGVVGWNRKRFREVFLAGYRFLVVGLILGLCGLI